MGFVYEGPGEQAEYGGEDGCYRDGGITAATYALRTASAPGRHRPRLPAAAARLRTGQACTTSTTRGKR